MNLYEAACVVIKIRLGDDSELLNRIKQSQHAALQVYRASGKKTLARTNGADHNGCLD